MDKKADLNNSDYRKKVKSLLGKAEKALKTENSIPEEAALDTAQSVSTGRNEFWKKLTNSAAEVMERLPQEMTRAAEFASEKLAGAYGKLSEAVQEVLTQQETAEDARTKPPEPEWDQLVLEEMETKGLFFSSLLDQTDRLVHDAESDQGQATQLLNKWEYAFAAGKCEGLAHKLKEQCQLYPDHPAEQLYGLMTMFFWLGLRKWEAPEKPVVVSVENRPFFENGRLFPDGTLCEIQRWPWLYGEKLFAPGMLQIVEEPAEDLIEEVQVEP